MIYNFLSDYLSIIIFLFIAILLVCIAGMACVANFTYNNICQNTNLCKNIIVSKQSNPFQNVWSIQKKQEALALLEHLHNVTDKYFLMYGTLLGYVRHNKQIIPWDDDLDVGPRALPRDSGLPSTS